MFMLHQPPVHQEDSQGRHAVTMTRAGLLLAAVASVVGATALLGWGGDREVAQVMPSSTAFQPATLQSPATTPAPSMRDAPTASQPTENDESQQAYATHGG